MSDNARRAPVAGERPGTGAEKPAPGPEGQRHRTYIFANAGTDFPPIIEAFATLDGDRVPMFRDRSARGRQGSAWRTAISSSPAGRRRRWFTFNVGAGQFGHGRHSMPPATTCRVVMMSGRTPFDRGQPGGRARDADPVRPGNVTDQSPRWSPMW